MRGDCILHQIALSSSDHSSSQLTLGLLDHRSDLALATMHREASADLAQSQVVRFALPQGADGVSLIDGERYWLRMESPVCSANTTTDSSDDLRLVSAYGCCSEDAALIVRGEALLANQALALTGHTQRATTKRNHCNQLLCTTYGTYGTASIPGMPIAQRFTASVDVVAQSITISISETVDLGPSNVNTMQICDHDAGTGFPGAVCESFVIPAATSPQSDPSTPAGRRYTFFADASGIAMTAGKTYWFVYNGAVAYATGFVPNPSAAIVPQVGLAVYFNNAWTNQFFPTARMLMILNGCLGVAVSEPELCREELGTSFGVPDPSMGTLTSQGVKFLVMRDMRLLNVSLAFGATGDLTGSIRWIQVRESDLANDAPSLTVLGSFETTQLQPAIPFGSTGGGRYSFAAMDADGVHLEASSVYWLVVSLIDDQLPILGPMSQPDSGDLITFKYTMSSTSEYLFAAFGGCAAVVDPTPSVTPSPSATSSPSSSPTPSASSSPTPSSSASASVSPSPSVTPSASSSVTASITPSPSRSSSPSASPSPTSTPSATPSVTPSETPSVTPSTSPSTTSSITPTSTPSVTPSSSPSASSTQSPSPSSTSSASASPSITTSATPTPSASASPTSSISSSPSTASSTTPTSTPTPTASSSPSVSPSSTPSASPSPSTTASATGSMSPSGTPFSSPSSTTTPSPSGTPTVTPSPSTSVTPPASPTTTPSISSSAPPSATPSVLTSPTGSLTPSPCPSPSSSVSPTPSASSSMSPSSTASGSPSRTPTASASASASPSGTSSSSATSTPSRSTTPSPSSSSSFQPAASSSQTPSLTPSASPTPSPSPSTSPLAPLPSSPALSLITAVTAAYESTVPGVELSVQGDGGSSASSVGISAKYQGATFADDAPAPSVAAVSMAVQDRPIPGNPEAPLVPTYVYTITLVSDEGSTIDVEQSFATHTEPAEAEFASTPFTIPEGTVTFSIGLSFAESSSPVSGEPLTTKPLTLSYDILSMSSWAPGEVATIRADTLTPIVVARDVPRPKVTTYWLPLVATDLSLSSSQPASPGGVRLVARVEVFDVAIVDGEVVPLVQHSIVRSETGGYLLSITFPAIERTLQYDPTISLGVLLPAAAESGSSGGFSNIELMIGAGVAVPIALVLGVVAAVVGTVMMRRRRQKATALVRKKLAAAEMGGAVIGDLSGAAGAGASRYSLDEQANELWDNRSLRASRNPSV